MNTPSTAQDLVARMRRGRPAFGTFTNLGSPLAAEACARAGVDWLLVDLEHGGAGEESLLTQLLAAEAHGTAGLVRVESDQRVRAGHALDLGARGVMFPRIDTAEQAADAVSHLRYPPEGDRGVATYNRACGFGLDTGALDRANDEVIGIVQIESPRAVENAPGIAAVDGVDVLFVGPRDLTHALGIPGQVAHPDFRSALRTVLKASEDEGKAAGILANTSEAASAYVEQGFSFVGVGSDSSLLASAVATTVNALAGRTGSADNKP